MLKKIFLLLIIFILLCSCGANRQIVKYKTYKFNEYIQLETLKFKPFKDYNSFKAKITFTLKNGKNYSFYALVYKNKDYSRIFCYTFFGKKVIDIFFGLNNFVVPDNQREVYIIYPNNVDKKESLFYFLKEILSGIPIKNAKILNSCITGEYNNFKVVSCENSNFKKVYFYNKKGILKREFDISKKEIILKLNGNIIQVNFKEKIKSKNFKKDFFNYIKNFKTFYVKNLKTIEDNLLK